MMRWFVAVALVFAQIAAAQVPERCRQYQRLITSTAHNEFGLNAPVSTLAAQLEQESSCNPNARSIYAAGLAQFTPSTAADMAARYPRDLAPADPTNPRWAVLAQARYMHDLLGAGEAECDRWAFALSSYNGGSGWLERDRNVCRATPPSADWCSPCNADRWFGNVESTPDQRRSAAAIAENRGYPRRILRVLTPRYVSAGYGRGIECVP